MLPELLFLRMVRLICKYKKNVCNPKFMRENITLVAYFFKFVW